MEKNRMVPVWVNGKQYQAAAGSVLSELLAGLPGFRLPCAGQGRCGKCRVFARGGFSPADETERRFLSGRELDMGVRLACRARILGACRVAFASSQGEEVLTEGMQGKREAQAFARAPLFRNLGAAVDVGTTTLAVSLFDRNGCVTRAGAVNPQVSYGADVISRMERSLAGEGAALAQAVRKGISRLLADSARWCGRRAQDIDALVVTGNTAMLYLLLQKDPRSLSRAPFLADWLGGETVPGERIFPDCPQAAVYFPHCISAFIGADILTALLATRLMDTAGQGGATCQGNVTGQGGATCQGNVTGQGSATCQGNVTGQGGAICQVGTTGQGSAAEDACPCGPKTDAAAFAPRMLADIGTNGEVALWTGERLLCCSTSAGPAFEGVGLSMGMDARPGAVSRVWIEGDTMAAETIGQAEPAGICGSGAVDATACLLRNGSLDKTGYLERGQATVAGDVRMDQSDIRKIQLAKAAIRAGMETLLHQAGISAGDLGELLVAGGFGSRLDLENAMAIGLLPRVEGRRVTVCGNAALAGAELLLQDRRLQGEESKILAAADTVELATDPFFQEHFIAEMAFPAE